jgi:hypothetical protein
VVSAVRAKSSFHWLIQHSLKEAYNLYVLFKIMQTIYNIFLDAKQTNIISLFLQSKIKSKQHTRMSFKKVEMVFGLG